MFKSYGPVDITCKGNRSCSNLNNENDTEEEEKFPSCFPRFNYNNNPAFKNRNFDSFDLQDK